MPLSTKYLIARKNEILFVTDDLATAIGTTSIVKGSIGKFSNVDVILYTGNIPSDIAYYRYRYDAINNVFQKFALRDRIIETNLVASTWSNTGVAGGNYIYELNSLFSPVNLTGYEYDITIDLSNNCTKEQYDAYCAANMIAYTDHSILALGEKPTINIPVIVTIKFRDALLKGGVSYTST